MNLRLVLMAAGLLASAPGLAEAQGCGGKAGWVLTIPDEVEIGSTVTVDLVGPANEMGLLMISAGQGPIQSRRYGTICLDFPLLTEVHFTLDATGHHAFDVDCDPTLVGITVYSQFITCRPNVGISNQVATTFIDAIHAGDLCTYTQGGWGTNCNGNNPGCLLDTWFTTLFPNGLLIGDQGGINDGESGLWAARWDTAAAVQTFLPIGGGPGPLTYDAINPTTLPACVFAGQLVAAKLNCAFDDAGVFDSGKCRIDLKLCDLVFVAGVHSKLIGWTVRDLIGLADQAIACELGAGPFDVDGDSIGDVTFSNLNSALDVFNNNFDNCNTNNGNLELP
ncbi:MAG: hypothetical protein FJ293_00585 [Planctomycetes bacterium]|nr:hypothetical protein [Planctomycetota bacterium]